MIKDQQIVFCVQRLPYIGDIFDENVVIDREYFRKYIKKYKVVSTQVNSCGSIQVVPLDGYPFVTYSPFKWVFQTYQGAVDYMWKVIFQRIEQRKEEIRKIQIKRKEQKNENAEV